MGPVGGLLSVWIDYNADGDWKDAAERVFTDVPVNAGVINSLTAVVPAAAHSGPTFARFRISSAGGLGDDGLALDGEVEDYQVQILSHTPGTPDLLSDAGIPGDNLTNLDNSASGKALQLQLENTVSGATVTILADGVPIGTAVATGATTLVMTEGARDLSDGQHAITARQTEPGAPESLSSPTLMIWIDTTAPSVVSCTRQSPAGSPTNADTLVFRVTFDEAVTNVDAADLAVTGTTATVSGVAAVSGSNGTQYDVTLSGGDLADFNGTVGLDLKIGQNITDLAGNALPTTEPGIDETYTVSNGDVRIYVPDDLPGAPGGSVSVPVKVEVLRPAGVTIGSFDIVIEFDASRFTVSGSQLGSLLTGSNSDLTGDLSNPVPGKLIYSADATNGSVLFAQGTVGDLFTVMFTVAGNAPEGASPMNLMAKYSTALTAMFDNGGKDLLFLPAPTNASSDNIDGVVTIDNPPTVTGLSPADDAVGVAVNENLAIAFSEAIRKGAGTVVIRKSADNSAVATIDVSSPTVTVAGSTVTIDPESLLAGSTSFYVEVSAGAFEDLAGTDFAGISGPTAWNFNTNLIVTSLTPTSTGFYIRFNRDLAVGVLNLYDQGSVLGPADLTLSGLTVGDVRGSLVVGPDPREATFIKTNTESDLAIPGLLQPDQYTVTLKSGATAFCDPSGGLLDGDGNGTPGGDYVGNFTVAAPAGNAVIVSLPNVTRGYGQPVNLPADNLTAGLPLTISNGLGVTRVELEIRYDPRLLTITAFTLDPAVMSRAAYVLVTSTPGRAVLTITASTGLAGAAGPLLAGSFTAVVPTGAPYAAQHVLDIVNLHVYDNAAELPALDDDAIHVAAFFGDGNGDGRYNSPDATLTRRIIGLINTGLSAYQLADPRLIVDISGNGYLQSNDTSYIRRAIGQMPVKYIPELPSGLTMTAARGADPLVYIPRDPAGLPDETVTVPMMIDVTEPAGITIGGFDLQVCTSLEVLLVVNHLNAQTAPAAEGERIGFAETRVAAEDLQDRLFGDLEAGLSPFEEVLSDLADDVASAWR